MKLVSVPIPMRMAHLRRERRGYPVTFVTFDPNGDEVDFRVTDPVKRVFAIKEKLCGICGRPLMKVILFIGGPNSIGHRIFSDPGMHSDCARYAAKVCPFIALDNYRVADKLPANTFPDAMQAVERPERMGFLITDGYALARTPGHPMMYVLANPGKVEWI